MSTDFPTASVGSSQAPTAAVEKSLSASHTKIRTLPRRTNKSIFYRGGWSSHRTPVLFITPNV